MTHTIAELHDLGAPVMNTLELTDLSVKEKVAIEMALRNVILNVARASLADGGEIAMEAMEKARTKG